MSVYAISDLHGFSLEKLRALLKIIDFGDSDWLYIVGDVIDRRGDGGVGILLWLLDQPNVQLIRGNHEQMMLDCKWVFDSITEENIDTLSEDKLKMLNLWMVNGGEPTVAAMRELLHSDPDSVEAILEYLEDTPLCESADVGGHSFVLCHAGFENFDKSKRFDEYSPRELLWHRPHPYENYFEDAMTVIGHTPTGYFGSVGRAFKTKTWIDIDLGVSSDRSPMILRLDDMKEIYF